MRICLSRRKEEAIEHQQKYVAWFERLSHDDKQIGESDSIPITREWIVSIIALLNKGMRDFIES